MKAREVKKAALETDGAIVDRRSALISAAQGRGGFFPWLSNLRQMRPNLATRAHVSLPLSLSLFLLHRRDCNLSIHCSLFYLLSVTVFPFFFSSCRASLCLLRSLPRPPPDALTGSSELEVSGTRRVKVAVDSLA